MKAAADYQNETIWKFVVWSLIRQNNLKEAQHILSRYYISDETFRYKSMLVIDFFLNPDGFCEKANFIVANPTFTEELKNFSRDKIQMIGTRCTSLH
jgi:transcription termination factor Rho